MDSVDTDSVFHADVEQDFDGAEIGDKTSYSHLFYENSEISLKEGMLGLLQ